MTPRVLVAGAVVCVVACQGVFSYSPTPGGPSDGTVGDLGGSNERHLAVDVQRIDAQSSDSRLVDATVQPQDGQPVDQTIQSQDQIVGADVSTPPDGSQPQCGSCVYIFAIEECRITCEGCELTCSGPAGVCTCGPACDNPYETKSVQGVFTCEATTLCNSQTYTDICISL